MINIINKVKSIFSKNNTEDTSNNTVYRLNNGHILIISNAKDLSDLLEVLGKNGYIELSDYIYLPNKEIGVVIKHK